MNYKIPLLDLNYDEKEEQAVVETLRTKWISTGPKTAEFENKFAQMLKVKYAVAHSSCTVTLHMSMRLMDIGPGDEVICPSLSFVATSNAVRYVNATPVFADIKSTRDINIDPRDIENKISKRTKAIIVMHFAGFACDMESIMDIAARHKLKVIEDACHGPLSDYKGMKLGTIGDAGCFSFDGHKNMTTGEGGMLVTNNEQYFEKARLLRSHAMTSMTYDRAKGPARSYDVVDLGFNYKYDDIRASIGLVQLEKLKEDLMKRDKLRRTYIKELKDVKGITIPFSHSDQFSANYIFTIVLENSTYQKRDYLRNRLAEEGIQTSVHYPAIHRFSAYKDYNYSLPVTEYVTDNIITLPLYSRLSEKNVLEITSAIKGILHEKRDS